MLTRKKQIKYEREFIAKMNKEGHACMRIAGSGCGKFSEGDCVLTKHRKVFLTEVKATKSEVLRINGDTKEQLQRLRKVALNNPPLIPMLVVRWKNKRNGRKWKYVDLSKELPKKVEYAMVLSKRGVVDFNKIVELRSKGMMYEDIAKHFGVTTATIRKYIVKYGGIK